MKRFDYDDDGDENLFPDTNDDDYYDDGNISPEEYAELQKRQEALTLMQLELVQIDLNQRILFQAMKMVKKNTWFYSFRSKETQLRMIAQAYQFLKVLASLPQQEGE